MRALDMGRLQFNPFTADVGPVIAPIELEGFIGFEHQKHLGAASRRLLGRVPICAPSTPKRLRHARRTDRSPAYQIFMQQLNVAQVFARLPRLGQKPR